jgi:hypothetical protein
VSRRISDGRVKANRIDSLEEESQAPELCADMSAPAQIIARAVIRWILSSLLLRQVANHRQLEHLTLIRLHEENEPDNEAAKPDHRPDKQREKT